MIFAQRDLAMPSPLPPLNVHPMAARDWRAIRAFAGRLKKCASLTKFDLFRFVR